MIDERETDWLLKTETLKNQTLIKAITRIITKRIIGSYFF